jgi:hypothetical protein
MPHILVGPRLSFDFGHYAIIAHHPLVLLPPDGHPFAVGVPFTLGVGLLIWRLR